MRHSNKIFRVFVSSTFTDMRVERRILQERVFPKLKTLCESKGATFQDVDLRWGVNEEAQLDQKTMDICLGEIARCQRLSPKPNFIILIGDKYGWQPLPARIPSAEVVLIKEKLTAAEAEIVGAWYREDLNAVPAEYVLQPRDHDDKSHERWERLENEIRTILRRAAAQIPFSEAQRVKYFTSATHQEILAGALSPPPGAQTPEEHVFAYLRTVKESPEVEADSSLAGQTDGATDPYARKQLAALREELANKLSPAHVHHYGAHWDKGCVLDDADAFALRVYDDMKAVIEDRLRAVDRAGILADEIARHEESKDQRIRFFTGRQELLAAIRTYLESDTDKALSVVGQPGTGKTSLMAKAIDEAGARPGVTVFRFIGTTSASSDTFRLLSSIIAEISRRYGVNVNSVLRDSGLDETMLLTLRGLRKALPKFLELPTSERPLFLFLDALDQLGHDGGHPALDWIPRKLPTHVKFVLSVLPEQKEKLLQTNHLDLEGMPQNEGAALLQAWLDAAGRTLQPRQKREVLDKFASNGTPLYLRLAFEQARTWRSYSPDHSLSPDIDGLLEAFFDRLEADHGGALVKRVCGYLMSGRYQGLVEQEILDLLVFDQEHWRSFVDSCHPDHRSEVEQMGKLPIVVWSRLFLDLEPYLAERDADGLDIISFYHRSFGLYAKRVGELRHATIADYFMRQPTFLRDLGLVPHVRKLIEQPYQLAMSGERWDLLESTLADLTFVDAKCAAGMTYELVGDIELALRGPSSVRAHEENGVQQRTPDDARGGSGGRPQRPATDDDRKLRDLVDFLRRLRHRLDVYPDLCLQELANLPDRSPVCRDAARLLDDQRRPWMRRVNKSPAVGSNAFSLVSGGHSIYSCAVSADGRMLGAAGWDGIGLWDLATGQRVDDEPDVTHALGVVAFCEEGLWIGFRSTRGHVESLHLLDAGSWDVSRTWRVDAEAIAFSPNARHVAIKQAKNDFIEVCDVGSGVPVRSLRDDAIDLRSVAGLSFASGSPSLAALDQFGHLAVWDTETWNRKHALFTTVNDASACALSPDASLVIVTHAIGFVAFDVASGRVVEVNREHADHVEGGCFSSDASLFISCARDGCLKAWRVADWATSNDEPEMTVPEEFRQFWGGHLLLHERSTEDRGIVASLITPDESTIVYSIPANGLVFCGMPDLHEKRRYSSGEQITALACSADGTTIALGMATGAVGMLDDRRVLHRHTYAVTACRFSTDGDALLSSSFDGTMMLSPVSGGGRTIRMHEHSSCVHDCAFSQGDAMISSASADGRIGLWSRGGRLVAALVDDGIAKHCCAFSPDGRMLAWGAANGDVDVCDVSARKVILTLRGHSSAVYHSAWSPDGATLTTASYDGTVRIWSVPDKIQRVLYAADAPFTTFAASVSGDLLFAGNFSGERFLLAPECAR